MRRPARRPARPAALPLAVLLVLGLPRTGARAEDYVDYRYEDYSEEGGRIGVRTQGLTASDDLGPDTTVGFTVLNDAISGASPIGIPAPAGSRQVPLANLADHRKAWEVDASRQWRHLNLAVGFAESREHDYVSRGWSVNSRTDFNQKNTELTAGLAGHRDQVETFFDPGREYQGKQAVTAIVGLRQLLDPLTFVTVNASWGRETGYLDDQYKLVQKTEELVPGSFFALPFAENRPGERNLGSLYGAVNRAFPRVHGAIEASYRYYADTFGIQAHTVELRWLQKLGRRVTVAPDLRLTREGAADFYSYDLDPTPIVPTQVPNSAGPAYSSDYRLSSFEAVSVGAHLTAQVVEHVQLNLGYERYAMRGRDGVTPQSAYPVANITTVGARITW